MSFANSPKTAAMAILFDLDACDRTIADEGIEIVGCPCSAAEVLGVIISAELAALRRINAPEPDALAMNFERVAVDDAGATHDGLGRSGRCCKQKDADKPSHAVFTSECPRCNGTANDFSHPIAVAGCQARAPAADDVLRRRRSPVKT